MNHKLMRGGTGGFVAMLALLCIVPSAWCGLRGPRSNVINDYVERGARAPDMTSDEYNTAVRSREQKKSARRVQDYTERGMRSPDMTSKEYTDSSRTRDANAKSKRVQNYIGTGRRLPQMTGGGNGKATIGPVSGPMSGGGGVAASLLGQAGMNFSGSAGDIRSPVDVKSTGTKPKARTGSIGTPSSGKRSLSPSQIKAIYAKD